MVTPLLPPGSCDTHAHLYPPREQFPLRSGAHFESSADLADYRALCRRLGVSRHVILQGKAHPDEASTLYAVAMLGRENSRAVIFFEADTTPDRRLAQHKAGVRGYRFLARRGEMLDLDLIEQAANEAAPLGWHLAVQAEAAELSRCFPRLAALPVPVVVDHIGRLAPGAGRHHPDLAALLGFIEGGAWIKLSAPYNVTPSGQSSFVELAATVSALVKAAPDRCIWATNFPHPNLPAHGKPDEIDTVRSLLAHLDNRHTNALFVDNPARLYGFEAAPL